MYNQVLTNSGAALLRDAVNAEKKIVFTRAICGSHYDMDSRGDLAAKPIDWYNGATGSISGVSAKASGLVVIAEFSAIESGTDPVKSACICVQIKKDGVDPEYDPADDVIFAAWCDDNSAYVSGDTISIKFELPIALSSLVDDSGSTSGDFVTLDTEQEITASKTFVDCNLAVSEDGGGSVNISSNSVSIQNSDGDNIFSIDDESIGIGEEYYEYSSLPAKVEYDTSASTVTLTLGDGTAITLTCTSVVEAE